MAAVQPQTLTPAAFLARLRANPLGGHELALLTGESGCGKTTWCLALIQQARARGLQPVGLVSPAVFQAGVKTGIDLQDIASGERRRLAVKRDPAGAPAGMSVDSLGWRFETETLAWGNQVLAALPPSPLMVLDELGPLEFCYQDGLVEGLCVIDRKKHGRVCAVIRPELLETALERWPWGQVIWVTSPAQARESA